MDGDIDMNPKDFAALEERLYSQCHHSYEVTPISHRKSPTVTENVATRIVSKTAIVNNLQSSNQVSKVNRYWATPTNDNLISQSTSQKTFFPWQPNTYPQQSEPLRAVQISSNNSRVNDGVPNNKFLAPYQSPLGYSNTKRKNSWQNNPRTESVLKDPYGASKPQRMLKLTHLKKEQPHKRKQLVHPQLQKTSIGKKKFTNKEISQFRKKQLESKNSKANLIRQLKQPTVIAQVFLDSSDDEPKPCSPISKDKMVNNPLYDVELDEVEIVPLPDPPKICIDCSDDEVTQESFAFPQAKQKVKKVTAAKVNSPRCLSPSNSSIMSDDFIGLHDRSRLSDIFTENIPNDDELECSIEAKRVENARKGKKNNVPLREQRAPSISSEETICSSSDTTDQERQRLQLEDRNISKTLLPSRRDSVGSKGKKDCFTRTDAEMLNQTLVDKSVEQSVSAALSNTTKISENSVPSKDVVASKSKSKCKSPISIALELTRKHFEVDSYATANITRNTKKKSKKDRVSDGNQQSLLQNMTATKHVAKRKTKVQSNPELKQLKARKTASLPFAYESVSSESDYELIVVNVNGKAKQLADGSVQKESSSKQPSANSIAMVDPTDSVSSESDLDESIGLLRHSTPRVAKPMLSKRMGRKRKQFNSETYSDEDFACMLTDIVRAVSDTDTDDEEEEQQDQESIGKRGKEVSDDAVTSTTTIADNGSEERKKQIKASGQSVKKKKRLVDACNATESCGGDKSTTNDAQVLIMDKVCDNAATCTTSITTEDSGTTQNQSSEPSSTKKKKRFNAVSVLNATTEVGKLNEEGDTIKNGKNYAACKTTPIEGSRSETNENQPNANSPATKKKRSIGATANTVVEVGKSDGVSEAGKTSAVVSTSERRQDRATLEDPCSIDILCTNVNKVVHVEGIQKTQAVQDIQTSYSGRTNGKNLQDFAWNEEMKLFYNNDGTEENFSLPSIMQAMPRGRKHWNILHQDLYPDPPKKEIICNRCGERGHMRYKCKNTPKPLVCYMCGENGHQEPRCPRTLCLNCGAKTRNFVRGCIACARDFNSICRNCGVRGHFHRKCPDLWRRYHSTIKDNVPLKQKYQVNMKSKYCCICCKPGHQAHVCTAAYRIFGIAVPTIHIKSYQPSYPVNQQCYENLTDSVPRYNLFSDDADKCKLNLHELAENPNGFYYRFAKTFDLLRELQQQQVEPVHRMIQEDKSQEQRQEHEEPVQGIVETRQDESVHSCVPQIASNREENHMPICTPSTTAENHDPVYSDGLFVEPENSSYSFSELFAEQEHVRREENMEIPSEKGTTGEGIVAGSAKQSTHRIANVVDTMPDYIPISSGPKSPEREQEKPADGKVYLTKEHAKILVSELGTNFMNEAAEKYFLKLSISFSVVGNMLVVSGPTDAQDRFHEELVLFLTTMEKRDTASPKTLGIPMQKSRAFKFVFGLFLNLCKQGLGVHDIYRKYSNVEKNNLKEKCRWRRILNRTLFGQYGLRNGRMHVDMLRRVFVQLANSESQLGDITPEQLLNISTAFVYIFSTYDHVEYDKIIGEYDKMCEISQPHKFHWSYLQMEKFPVPRNTLESMKRMAQSVNQDFKYEDMFIHSSAVPEGAKSLHDEQSVRSSLPTPNEGDSESASDLDPIDMFHATSSNYRTQQHNAYNIRISQRIMHTNDSRITKAGRVKKHKNPPKSKRYHQPNINKNAPGSRRQIYRRQ